MKNIINYVEDEKSSFTAKAFNGVDSLILSQVAYLEFDGLVPTLGESCDWVEIKSIVAKKDSKELYRHSNVWLNKRLLVALGESPRFADCKINYYVNIVDYDKEKQFSAVTFKLSNGLIYIAFRGTDSSFVGWKEDFNMAFSNTIPAQEEAANYLNSVGDLVSGQLQVGGHSKGGNLAVYAAMKCQDHIRDRISHIFSHDAPGFREKVFQSPEYQQIKGLIHKYIPEFSLIGMLLENNDNYTVVKAMTIGVMQHNPFSWLVEDGGFHCQEEVNRRAIHRNKTLHLWLDSIDDEDRELFIDTLYGIIASTGAKTFSDLTVNMWEKILAISKAIQDIDQTTRHLLMQTVKSLLDLTVDNFEKRYKS